MHSTTGRPSTTDARDRTEPLRRLSNDRLAALTFDDGPDPRHTPRTLDLLAASGLHASFFVLGERATRHPALVRRIRREGHTLGSHGWSHRHPWWQAHDAAVADVTLAAIALSDVCGEAVRWYRPPFGRLRRCMLEAAAAEGQRVVLWSRSAIDWGPFGAAPAILRRLRRVRGGDIVLMHDALNKRNKPDASVLALETALPELRRRVRLVRLDDADASGCL
jgi:peptidoglycan-N-acetylglucosamine deacetylase